MNREEQFELIKEAMKNTFKDAGGFSGAMPNDSVDRGHVAGPVSNKESPDGPRTKWVMTDDQVRSNKEFSSQVGNINNERGTTFGDGHTNHASKNAWLEDETFLQSALLGMFDVME